MTNINAKNYAHKVGKLYLIIKDDYILVWVMGIIVGSISFLFNYIYILIFLITITFS